MNEISKICDQQITSNSKKNKEHENTIDQIYIIYGRADLIHRLVPTAEQPGPAQTRTSQRRNEESNLSSDVQVSVNRRQETLNRKMQNGIL